jgi:hypothetical protein
MWFELGGIKVSPQGALTFDQTYAVEESATVTRLAGGGAIKDTAWEKLAVTTTGTGRFPPGLAGLDYSQPLLMRCSAPREVSSASNVIVLPAARRVDADFVPQAYALLLPAGDDALTGPRWEPATIDSIVTNTATITPVAGALQYQVWYWPELTVFASRPQVDHRGQPAGAARPYSWTLEAREV